MILGFTLFLFLAFFVLRVVKVGLLSALFGPRSIKIYFFKEGLVLGD